MTLDRVHTRMPRVELERRWALAREHLELNGLDALVVLASDDFLGGYPRWFIDRPAYNAYHQVVIFYPDQPMTLVEHGPMGAKRLCDDTDPDYPGVGEVLYAAAFRSVRYLHGVEGELVRDALQRRNCKRVGVVGLGAMPHRFVTTLSETPGIKISDETEAIDRCKSIKSAAEIVEIRKTAFMQDQIFQHVLAHARPGMRDVDVAAIAQAEGRRLGSEGGVFFCGSAEPGTPAVLRLNRWQMRTIKVGDPVTLLIENYGPAGYYTELGRTFVFGRAKAELHDAFAIAREAQIATLARMVPGVACAEIAHAHDEHMMRLGLAPETRLFAHGQGYDLVERPLIRRDEPMVLEAGMSVVVHPAFVNANSFGYVCDNYIIGSTGVDACLHRTASKIFEIS